MKTLMDVKAVSDTRDWIKDGLLGCAIELDIGQLPECFPTSQRLVVELLNELLDEGSLRLFERERRVFLSSPDTEQRLSLITAEPWTKEDWKDDYARLMCYVAGSVNEYGGIGRIGTIKGEIAKKLIADDPTLAAYDRRIELMDKVEAIYRRDHMVTVTLSQDEIDMCRLLAMPSEGEA